MAAAATMPATTAQATGAVLATPELVLPEAAAALASAPVLDEVEVPCVPEMAAAPVAAALTAVSVEPPTTVEPATTTAPVPVLLASAPDWAAVLEAEATDAIAAESVAAETFAVPDAAELEATAEFIAVMVSERKVMAPD